VDNLSGTHGSTRNIDHLLGDPQFSFVRENVVDWASAADLAGVYCVFHQAASKKTVALADPERDLAVNALGTLRLLEAARSGGVRKVVHASTGSVFGRPVRNQDEHHPTRPVSHYGTSKLAAESYYRVYHEMYGLDYTVLRYYHVIGPRQDHSETGGVLPIFVRRCLDNRPVTIYGTGEQVRSFTSVHDVVRVNLWASESKGASTGDFNCASGIRVSIQTLAEFVMAELDCDRDIEYRDWRPGDILEFPVDNSKLRQAGIAFDKDWRFAVREVIEEMAYSRTAG
jgi:UDP-glucose 4-epimerase